MVWQTKACIWMEMFSTRCATVLHLWVLLPKIVLFLRLFNDIIGIYLCVCEQGLFFFLFFFSTDCKHSCFWGQRFVSFHRWGSLDEVVQGQIFRITSFYYNSVTVKHRNEDNISLGSLHAWTLALHHPFMEESEELSRVCHTAQCLTGWLAALNSWPHLRH